MFGTNHKVMCTSEVTNINERKDHNKYLYLTLNALGSIKKLCISKKRPQESTMHLITNETTSKIANISNASVIIYIFLNRLASKAACLKLNPRE